jgi:hypothetical protein
MTNTNIERSAGLPIVVGYGFYGMAGGGYRGLTAALDQTVQRAAERLTAAYRMPVVIRFNSNRESGGAFLRTHEIDGLDANAEVGIWAQLITERTIAVRQRYDLAGADELPGTIHVGAHIRATSLADQRLRELPGWRAGGAWGVGYYHCEEPSIAAALALCLRAASIQPQRASPRRRRQRARGDQDDRCAPSARSIAQRGFSGCGGSPDRSRPGGWLLSAPQSVVECAHATTALA